MRRLTREMFVRAGAPASAALCSEESPWSNRLLAPSCPLFARKFSNHTADAVRSLLIKTSVPSLCLMWRDTDATSIFAMVAMRCRQYGSCSGSLL